MSLLQFHVGISLVALAAGLVLLLGLVNGRRSGGWAAAFLLTTILTSVSGFPLPPFGFDPPRAVGVLSLVLLGLAVVALYAFRLGGAWRKVFIGTATAALYLNAFVAVIQAFSKIPALNALAPTQSEAPFLVAQAIVLCVLGALGFFAWRRSGREAAL